MMTVEKKVYDALIIGAGPAGLSAALALSRVKRTALVLAQTKFRNDGIQEMHSVLGHDKRHPAEFRKMGRQNVERYGDGRIEFVEGEAVRIAATEISQGHQGFELESRDRGKWHGRKLILAVGSRDIFPDIEGYKENWPDNIYQCLFCDGRERSHLPIGLMGFASPAMLSHALMVCNMSTGGDPTRRPNLTIFTNGPLPTDQDKPLADAVSAAEFAGCKFEYRKVVKLTRLPAGDDERGLDIHLADGDTIRLGFLADRPPTAVAGEQMLLDGLPGLEIERDWMGSYIKRVNEPFGETSIKGVFAPGDSGTNLKQVTVAMTQGTLAAVGVVQQVCGAQAEELLETVRAGAEGDEKSQGV